MKRFSVLAILALLLSLSAQVPAAASTGDAKPNCADFTGGDATYLTDANGHRIFKFELALGADSCRWATYNVYVFSDATATTPVATMNTAGGFAGCNDILFRGDTSCVSWTIDLTASGPSIIYFFATSTFGQSHVVDRAPDAGAANRTIDGSVGGENFN